MSAPDPTAEPMEVMLPWRTRHGLVPRPGAIPIHPRLDEFVRYYATGQHTALRAAILAGWKGNMAAVQRRAERALRRPEVQALLAEHLENIRRSVKLMSPAELLGRISAEARIPDEVAHKTWWQTAARTKAREMLMKHYSLLQEVIAVRDLPKDPASMAATLAHELRRLGMTSDGSPLFGVEVEVPAPAQAASP